MTSKMKNYLMSLWVLSVIIAVSLTGCGKNEESKKVSSNTAVADTVPVNVTKAEIKDIDLIKTFSGTLEGEEQANIVAKIPERIISIKVKVGDNVSSGQTLVELDKSGASSQFYQAQAAFLNSEKDLKRMEALYKEAAIYQQMLDGTQTGFNISKENFDAAKSAVELTCPIAGVVTAVNNNIGDLAALGIPLITVASIGRMKVIFNVGEEDIQSFAVGQQAQVYSELKKSLVQSARISQISKSADIQSRSFEINALFGNTGNRWFKPGMFSRVNVEMKSKKGSVVIPNTAIINEATRKVVYVITDGKAYFKTVETGITDGNVIEVVSGISKGDVVAILGMNSLKEGSKVHISNK
jgi:membrane fusion protein (multidrug efflux system)